VIDELELTEEQAESIVQKAMDFQVYTDDMPDTPKGRLEAAHEVVAFTIDSWQQENPEPDSAAGKDMIAMFDLAGITINEDGTVEYGSSNGTSSQEPEQEPAGEGVEPFDIDSYIEGYSELTAATKIKKIKAKELDPNDDDDYNTLVSIAEWEETQESPSSRVLDYLNEIIPPADDGEGDGEAQPEAQADDSTDDTPGEEPEDEWTEDTLKALERGPLKEVAESFGIEFPQRLTGPGKRKVVTNILEAQEAKAGGKDEPEAEQEPESSDEPLEAPWEDYDEASDDDIIAVISSIEDYVEGDPAEALEYVLRYERSMEEPSEAVLEALEARLSSEEPEPEAKKTGGRTSRASWGKQAASSDPDVNDDVEQAVANDDAKEKDKKAKGSHLGQLADAAIKSSEHSAALRKAGLGAPLDFEGDMPELPEDIDAVDHSQLSNLMHAFQNALSTATWQASTAYIEADMFEEIADYLENRALLASDQTNDTKRKAEARTDEEYLKYRGLYKQRYHDYVRFRDLAKTLEGRVKVLSRTGGFKDDEQEAGDRSVTKRRQRKAA
jgi:hypothetical protein